MIVFQDPGSLSPRMTVQTVAGLCVMTAAGKPSRQMVAKLWARIGLDHTLMVIPARVLGGRRQLVAIADAMILRFKLVVLDEPTSALDMTVQVQIGDVA
jgi:microcin C transport system ATP-binding protein